MIFIPLLNEFPKPPKPGFVVVVVPNRFIKGAVVDVAPPKPPNPVDPVPKPPNDGAAAVVVPKPLKALGAI